MEWERPEKIDVCKEWQTRDGRRVTQLVRFDINNGTEPLRGVVDGCIYQWYNNGRYMHSDEHYVDLIPVPQKYVGYANVYQNSTSGKFKYTANLHGSRNVANYSAGNDRVACVRVEFEHGQFDD